MPSHLARDTQTWPDDLQDIKALDRQQQSLDREGDTLGRLHSGASAARILVKYGVRGRTIASLAKIAPLAVFGEADRRRLLLRRAKLEISADLFINLCKKYNPSLSAFVNFYVDFVSHRYWRYRDPSLFSDNDSREQRLYADAVDEAYIAFDTVLGRLIAAAGPESLMILLSEHGMCPEPNSTEKGTRFFSIRASRVHELLGLDPKILG